MNNTAMHYNSPSNVRTNSGNVGGEDGPSDLGFVSFVKFAFKSVQ